MKKRNGVSLIVLIITIIVIIILAAAVILTMTENNPIENAKKANFISSVSNYKDELTLWVANHKLSNYDFMSKDLNSPSTEYPNIKDIITLKDQDATKFKIQEGKLVYIGSDVKELSWLTETNIVTIEENYANLAKTDEKYFDITPEGIIRLKTEYSRVSGSYENIPTNTEFWYNVTKLVIPEKVNGITVTGTDQFSFGYCDRLEKVYMPDTITSIDRYTFDSCDNLVEVKLSKELTNLSESLFYDCNKLENISIPSKVTSIENYAFEKCTSLKNIIIPLGVTSIEDYVFYDCSSLTNITINKPNGSITGSPWSAPSATVTWNP